MAAKKIIIPSDVQDSIKDNLNNTENEKVNVVNDTKSESKAETPTDDVTKQLELLRKQIAAMQMQSQMQNQSAIPVEAKPKKKIEERVADRGPMMNVHVPLDIKKKIMDVKNARNLMGEKISVDTIIYECILAWLDKNYDKIMAKATI